MFLPAATRDLTMPTPSPASERAIPAASDASGTRPTAVVEFGIVASVFLAYKAVRFLVRDDAATAYSNARDLIGFERSIRLFVEPTVQSWFLEWQSAIEALNWFYARVHLISTAAVLVLLFIVDPRTYLWLRRRLVALTVLALAVHVAYPLAPPRIVGAADMIDTLQRFGPAIYANDSTLSRMANPYAAMPSLHFGYAVLIAWALVRSPIFPIGRWLYLHPFLMLVAIVATANHYWLDAMVCAGLIGVVELVCRRRGRRAELRGMLHVAGGVPSLVTSPIHERSNHAHHHGRSDHRVQGRDLQWEPPMVR
jgi:hypothetical protein